MEMKNVPQLSNQEHLSEEGDEEEEEEKDLAAETSEEECSSSTGDSSEGTCTANSSSRNLPPSSQGYILLDRMRKDIELLQQKANEARTDEERYVRLSLVTKMEEQLAQEIGT